MGVGTGDPQGSRQREVHPAAAQGFTGGAPSYERARPTYPDAVVERIGELLDLRRGRTLVDLGAGTGKFTRLVTPSGATVVAAEPVRAMRSVIPQVAQDALVVAATAERLPLRTASVDAVSVAQAFHWFDGQRALREIHRVLRPGGRLALVWNVRDETVPWVAGFREVFETARGDVPAKRSGDWRTAFGQSDAFTPLQLEEVAWEESTDVATLVDRVGSISFVAALPDDARAEVFARVAGYLRARPELDSGGAITLPYRTETWWCQAR